MALVSLGLRLDEGLVARVDAVRGDVPRARWLRRAVEQALSDAKEPVVVEHSGGAVQELGQVSYGTPFVSPEVAARRGGVGSAVPAEQSLDPVEAAELARRQDEQAAVLSRSYLSSGSAKRGVGPVPKRKG